MFSTILVDRSFLAIDVFTIETISFLEVIIPGFVSMIVCILGREKLAPFQIHDEEKHYFCPQLLRFCWWVCRSL